MVRIVVSSSRPGTGKTSLILRMLEELKGFAVIQVKAGTLFSSVIADPHGDEADRFRKSGAGQVLSIEADARDYADAIEQAFSLVSLRIQGVLIETYPHPKGAHGDIVLFMTDRPDKAGIPAAGDHFIIIDITGNDPGETRGNADRAPIFSLHRMYSTPEEWSRFMAYLRGLIRRMEPQ